MYNLTEKQKEVIHKALITASDNGTLDEFTNEELKLINIAETIVNKLTIPVVVKSFYCENEHNHYQVCEKQCKTCLMEEYNNTQ